jgi:hypothetical protein
MKSTSKLLGIMRSLAIIALVAVVGFGFAACKTGGDPTYTVYAFTTTYAQYEEDWPTLTAIIDGYYKEIYFTSFNSSAFPNNVKYEWTENEVILWLIGKGFSKKKAEEETEYLLDKSEHRGIFSRRGDSVDYIIN